MKIRPGFFGSLFTGFRRWELSFDGESVVYAKTNQPAISIRLDTVTDTSFKPGAIWAAIKIFSPEQSITCRGVVNGAAKKFVSALRNSVGEALLTAIGGHEPEVNQLTSSVFRLFAHPRYLAHRDLEVWKSAIAAESKASLARVLALLGNPLLPREGATTEIREKSDLLIDVLSNTRAQVKARNERFVAEQIVRHEVFFDTVEKKPLTPEQRRASVVLEDRNLLVAAAGSGKTSTVVGMIGYGLLTKQYAPSDFLVLAFNKNAAKELDERINEQLRALLPQGERVKTKTFHALGRDILAVAEGRRPSVANFAGGREGADSALMEQLIQQCMSGDPEFAADWVTFRAVCFKAAKNPAEFKSLDDWKNFVRANGEYQNGKHGFLTIQGEIVKSQGELAIANWFYMQGIDYEYERPYEHDTSDLKYRQYRPDFYLPAIKTYVEHYALDKNGRPPAAFGARYAESMQWKAQLHAEKGTTLITTTFADFVSGELFSKLEAELKKRGQKFAPRPIAEVLTQLNKLHKTDDGPPLRTLLKHAKSNEVDEATLRVRIEGNPQPFRAQLFVRVFWKLMFAYEARLRQRSEIDFEDMIIGATHHVTANRFRHDYKLILVDEFQDISQARAKLIRSLLTQSPDCKLFAVGDDWQSIYRFAGSDIDVFSHFSDHFGVTETNHLTQTFRSNQGITEVAARFVQKNPSQISKRVQAQDPESQGVIVVRRYGTPEEMLEECEASLKEIAEGHESRKAKAGDEGEVETLTATSRKDAARLGLAPANLGPSGKRASVFLLGRYKHQKPEVLDKWSTGFRSLELTFKTVHSSKGLQADYVVVLGMHTGRYAFPSEISDDPLLELVMPNAESFPNAEERRLFYVAITRARHRVYLLGGSYAPSAFLTELVDDDGISMMLRYEQVASGANSGNGKSHVSLETCPQCRKGKLRKRSGKFGEFIGCSNFPNCKYSRKFASSACP